MLNGNTHSFKEKSLPVIVPLKIKGITFWVYLDTGLGRNNFISKEEIYRAGLKPVSHESHQIITVNRTKKRSLPVFSETIDSVDHKVGEKIQITIIKTPTLIELKAKYEHLHGKMFYKTSSEEYPIHLTLRDDTYCEIQTEQMYKVRPEDQSLRESHWFVHGGKDYADSTCIFARETSDCEKLYSLDVLGVED